MSRTGDSADDVVLDRLRETLDSAIRDPSHSLASMMTEAYRSLLRVAHVQRNAFGASPTLSTTSSVAWRVPVVGTNISGPRAFNLFSPNGSTTFPGLCSTS